MVALKTFRRNRRVLIFFPLKNLYFEVLLCFKKKIKRPREFFTSPLPPTLCKILTPSLEIPYGVLLECGSSDWRVLIFFPLKDLNFEVLLCFKKKIKRLREFFTTKKSRFRLLKTKLIF